MDVRDTETTKGLKMEEDQWIALTELMPMMYERGRSLAAKT